MFRKDIKEYGCFQPGTYWIYRDSATGTIDSVYVTETIRSISHNKVDEKKYHDVEILKWFGKSDHSGTGMTLAADRGNTVFYHGSDNVVIIIFDLNSSHVSSLIGNGINRHEVLANYTLQNNNYSDVHLVSYYQKINMPYGYILGCGKKLLEEEHWHY